MDVKEIKQKIVPILRKHKVAKAAIFGSAARGEMKKDSDIDLLVEIKDDISLLGFIGLKLEIERALKRKVDLVEYGTIKPALADRIASEEVSIL